MLRGKDLQIPILKLVDGVGGAYHKTKNNLQLYQYTILSFLYRTLSKHYSFTELTFHVAKKLFRFLLYSSCIFMRLFYFFQ